MSGPKQTKVAVVESCEFRLIQSLDNRQDRRVNEANIGIRIAFAELTNAKKVLWKKILDDVRTIGDIVKQRDKGSWSHSLLDPIIDFDQNRSGYDKRFSRRFDELSTSVMIGVVLIQRRVQRAGVEDQRHDRGTGRSTVERIEVSECPDAPIPRLRGLGRDLSAFSSIASRITVASDTPLSSASRRNRSSSSSGATIVVLCIMCYAFLIIIMLSIA